VDIPAGVSDAMELRIGGAGHTGRAGGSPGDLYLSVRRARRGVERHGQDMFAVLEAMVRCRAGAEVEVNSSTVRDVISADLSGTLQLGKGST
jgi:molecular chaperone DnaJ